MNTDDNNMPHSVHKEDEGESMEVRLERLTRDFIDDETITVTFGDHHERFTVSRLFLRSASPYFRYVIGPVLHMSPVDPTTFRLWLLYSRSGEQGLIHCFGEDLIGSCLDDEEKATKMHLILVRLWEFGEDCEVPGMSDSVIREMKYMLIHTKLRPGTVKLAFGVSQGSLALCQTFVESISEHGKEFSLETMSQFHAIEGFSTAFASIQSIETREA